MRLAYLFQGQKVKDQGHHAINADTLLVGCVAQLVERRSLTGELSLSCAQPAADG